MIFTFWSGPAAQSQLTQRADLTFGFTNFQMIDWGTGEATTTQWPAEQNDIRLRAMPFEQELVTTQTLTLDQDYVLSYLPVVQGFPLRETRIHLLLMTDGAEPIPLISSKPVFSYDPELKEDARFDAFRRMVRVDLSAYTGRTIKLRWVAQGLGAVAVPMLGMLKLRPLQWKERRPDILLICSDTHRYDHVVGERGESLMPFLQELRKRSVTFTRAFSTASWTLPSITSIFTGLYPQYHRTGERLQEGKADQAPKQESLPPGQFVIGWGEDFYVFTAYPKDLSGLSRQLQTLGYSNFWAIANPFYEGSGLSDGAKDVVFHTGAVPGTFVNLAAARLLKLADPDQPLALLVHYMDVHEYLNWYNERYPPVNEQRDFPEADLKLRYADRVRDCDTFARELVSLWDNERGFDQSLVAFYADHGEHLYESDAYGMRIRGHGNTMQEPLLHIPMIVHFPDQLGLNMAGRTVDDVVSLVDLYPAALEAAGLESEKGEAGGESLLRTARGEVPTERTFFADHQLYNDKQSSVRRGKYKLILNHTTGKNYLIDTSITTSTQGEIPGMQVRDAAIEQELRTAYDDYVAKSAEAASHLKSDRVIDPETLKRLKGIGYLK